MAVKGYSRRPNRDDTDVIGARIGAQIVDSIAMGILLFVPMWVLGGIGGLAGESAGAGMSLIGLLVGGVLALGYGFLLEGLWDGYTVGKRLFGIKVVEEDGSPCSLGSAFVRNLLEIIDGFLYYVIGFVAMALSDRRQRIGDRLAGTVVVRESPQRTGISDDAPVDSETPT